MTRHDYIRPVADEPATCSVCGQWTQFLDPGYITPTCTDCAGRPYGGQA